MCAAIRRFAGGRSAFDAEVAVAVDPVAAAQHGHDLRQTGDIERVQFAAVDEDAGASRNGPAEFKTRGKGS